MAAVRSWVPPVASFFFFLRTLNTPIWFPIIRSNQFCPTGFTVCQRVLWLCGHGCCSCLITFLILDINSSGLSSPSIKDCPWHLYEQTNFHTKDVWQLIGAQNIFRKLSKVVISLPQLIHFIALPPAAVRSWETSRAFAISPARFTQIDRSHFKIPVSAGIS
jgi:hypothetical protein